MIALILTLVQIAAAATLDLETATRLAAEHSLDAEFVSLSVRQNEIDERVASQAWTPDLLFRASGQGSLGRTFSEQLGVNITEPVASLSTSLSASMPLYQGGGLRARREFAKASLQGALSGQKHMLNTLHWLAADGLLQIELAEASVAVQQAALQADQALLELVSLQVQAGSRTPADQHSQQAVVSRREAAVADATRALEVAELTLLDLLRLEPAMGWTFEAPPALEVPPSAEVLVSTAVARRPDLAAAQDQVRASLASQRVARSAYLPLVSLGAGASTSWLSSNPDPLLGQVEGHSRTWASIDLSLPLLDAGVRRGRSDTAAVSVRQAELAQQRLLDQVALEIRSLVALDSAAQVSLAASSVAMRAAQQAAEVLALRYQSGAESLVSVTGARAAQVQAELESVRAESELQRIRYQIRWATGELES